MIDDLAGFSRLPGFSLPRVGGVTIGVGGIRYEVNSFAAGVTDLGSFERYYVRRGNDVLSAGPNTEVYGAVQVANEAEVQLVGLLDTFGGCGPLVHHDAYLELKGQFLDQLAACHKQLDAVYLPLHGAMASTRCGDVEADLSGAVRSILGPDKPLIVSQDLHGAPSAELLEACDALIGFKTCPHIDYEETGAKALTIAIEALARRSTPITIRHPLPMLTPAEGHDTQSGPMALHMTRLQEEAEALGLLDASIFMCQPWLDAPRTGWCLTAVLDGRRGNQANATRLLSEEAGRLWSVRESLRVDKVSVTDAVRMLAADKGTGPILLADGGDSPSAGSTGDSTDLLTALIQMDDPRPRLAVVTDPEAAATLHELGVGATTTVTVGARVSPGFTDPITVTGTVVAASDGQFMSAYPAGPVDIGRTVALTVKATTVVITERPAMMLDQQVYRHLGLDPSTAWAIQVKSAGGFRALWSDVSTRVISVDTRGPSDGNLGRLPFKFAPQTTWPLHVKDPKPPQDSRSNA